MLPNFLVCGTSAGGTSFLTAGMLQHHEIYFPKKMRPEPHYFYKSWEYEKPLSYYEEKYFSDVKDEKAIGERSSSYMFSDKVAERIYKHLPDVKLIFMLRNPIERTYANYRYTVLEGLEKLSFEGALAKEKERVDKQEGVWAEIQPYNYTGRGFYASQLKRFLEYFDRDNMLILKSDAFAENPKKDFEEVFRFLEVDDSFQVVVPSKFTSLSVKDRKLQVALRNYFQDRFDLFVEAIRKEDDVSSYVHNKEDLEKLSLLWENLKGTKESMSEESRAYLQNVFREDICELSSIVNFSVDDWK